MADLAGLGLLTDLKTKDILDELKWRSRVVQLLGAGVLFGAAVIALIFSPTAAIVFAALAVAGVRTLPSTRRIRVDDMFALRDPSGRPHLLMSTTSHGTFIQFLDDNANPRLVLALGEAGGPIVALTDSDGQVRAALTCQAGTGEAVLSLVGAQGQQLGVAAPRAEDPYLIVKTGDGRKSSITADYHSVEAADGAATILSAGNDAIPLHCSNGTSEVDLMLKDEFTGMLVHTPQTTGLVGVRDGAVVTVDQAAIEREVAVSRQQQQGPTEPPMP